MTRPTVLVLTSLVAWLTGLIALALTLWQDANYSGQQGDVAAGLAGLGFLVGFGVFITSTSIGAVLARVATRRAPELRFAALALGLNIVSLVGVLLSALLLIVLR